MNIVFKNQRDSAPAGAEKMYRDALVSKGTLMLLDFSNKGTTFDFDLSRGVFDLARDAAEELNVFTAPELKTSLPVSISSDKGFPGSPTGGAGNADFTKGLLLHGLGKYLYETQPKTIVIYWIKLNMELPSPTTGLMVRTKDVGASGNVTLQSASAINPTISARLADKVAFANKNVGTNYVQVAIEFTGSSTANKVYVNGVYDSDGTTVAGSFVANDVEDILRIGFPSTTNALPITLYRMLIEDLEESGRTGLEVVQKDYNYVNALGEFAGIQKRPFASA